VHEFADGVEGPTPDSTLCDEAEPPLPLVEPGRVGGSEVEMVARAAGQPRPDGRVLVGAVVVEHEVHVEADGPIGVDVTQEGEELLVAMPASTLRQNLSTARLERCEQRGGAVARLVVGAPFDIAQSHRQQGLRPFDRRDQPGQPGAGAGGRGGGAGDLTSAWISRDTGDAPPRTRPRRRRVGGGCPGPVQPSGSAFRSGLDGAFRPAEGGRPCCVPWECWPGPRFSASWA